VKLLSKLAVLLFLTSTELGADDSIWPPLPPRTVSDAQRAIDRTKARAAQITIPQFELKNAYLLEAIEILKRQARENDPQGVGVEIELGLEAASAKKVPAPVLDNNPAKPTSRIPGIGDAPAIDPFDEEITVSLTDIPITELLRYVTGLSGCKYRVTATGFRIVPDSENVEEMVDQVFPLPPAIFGEGASPEALGVNKGAIERMKHDLRQYLIEEGVVFKQGASCAYDEKRLEITVKNTVEAIEYIHEILKSLVPGPPPLIPGPEIPKWKDSPQEEPSIKHRAKRLILKSVVLKGVPLSEAARRLRDLSVAADLGKPEIDQRGVIVVCASQTLTGLENADAVVFARKRIQYRARNVSLFSAATAIAEKAGGELVIQEYALVIAPKQPPALSEREFLVPPTFLNGIEKVDAKDYLMSSGMTFAPGPAAIYLPSSLKLIVQNSQARLKEIEKIVVRAWQDYYASEDWKIEKLRQERLRQERAQQ